MLISTREACQILAGAGVSLRCAHRVLASGLAGEALVGRTVALYEEARVRALAERPFLSWPEVAQLCPPGFFVSRRDFPATAPRPEQISALSGEWGAISPWTWISMRLQVSDHGSLPFIATVGGLVVLGADIVETRGLSKLVLEPPGSWFEAMACHWFPTGPGRQWVLHLSAPAAPEKIAG